MLILRTGQAVVSSRTVAALRFNHPAPVEPGLQHRITGGEGRPGMNEAEPTAPAAQGRRNGVEERAPAWWWPVVRGVCAILFGLAAYLWPRLTLELLALLFGIYAAADGFAAILSAALGRPSGPSRGLLALRGFLGAVVGAVIILWPRLVGLGVLLVIATWALLSGASDIAYAVRRRQTYEGAWLIGLGGALSILVAILLLAFPHVGALTIAWIIGGFALLYGIVLIAQGLRLRGR
jgi:uncharacterized membrane protein HdeD (DUF308 family)